jgi:hypothetical protein
VLVVAHTQEILAGASERALKAVDLANALRSRVGVAVLARVRTHRGGLLSLLERHDDVLEVFRVPKHDVCAVWKSSRRWRGNSTLSRRHHIEGVGRLKFDFHAGCAVASAADQPRQPTRGSAELHAELELRGADIDLGVLGLVVGVERLVFVVFRGMGAMGGPRPIRVR